MKRPLKNNCVCGFLAILLITAVCIGAASAVRDISYGDTAFVYEEITINGAATEPLHRYSGDASPVIINTINPSGDKYQLLEASVDIYTGVYYVSGNPLESGDTINIYYPSMTLRGYIGDGYETVAGKIIDKNTNVRFEIESQYVGTTGLANVTIFFTTPNAGKTSVFGTFDFANQRLTNVQTAFSEISAGDDSAAGSYTAQAEFVNGDDIRFIGISDTYKKSNIVTFTLQSILQSSSLTLTADKDSVVRNNPFQVTIQGESLALYFVYLDGASTNDINPTLQPSQSGMQGELLTFGDQNLVPVDIAGGTSLFTFSGTSSSLDNTSGYFKTDASGKRTIQYNTLSNTTDKTYTIKVVGMLSSTVALSDNVYSINLNEKVKVVVEKGSVTVAASGDRTYYIGEEAKITGTNTDSSEIYLFITGPNLISDGEVLYLLPNHMPAYNASQSVTVKTDNTWEYKWDTINCGLDTGAYTIYATSRLTNGKSSNAIDNAVALSNSEYATVSISLKQPFLSATPSATYVAKGDKIYIRGIAEGDPAYLKIYIFGPNRFFTDTISVEDNSTYEYKLEVASDWSSNQYFIVFEHPMYNGIIDVIDSGLYSDPRTLSILNWDNTTQASFIVWGANKLQGSNAADALTMMIDSPNIDDIYTKLTITVQEPWIRINNPGDQAVNTTFTVSGTTNLAVGDQILVEIASSSFTAIDKTSTSATSGYSQSTRVISGDGVDNAWSIEVDSTNFKLDEYTIKASGIEADVTTTTNFNIVEKVNPNPPVVTDGNIAVQFGWNFISVPKTLKSGNNTAASVFEEINMDNRSILSYNSQSSTWSTLKGTDVVSPMTGYWIYSEEPKSIQISYPENPTVPPTKNLYAGWNAIGLSAESATRSGNALAGTAWRTLIPWNVYTQTWDTAIINTATGDNSPNRNMNLGNGHWLYVDENSVLTGLTA